LDQRKYELEVSEAKLLYFMDETVHQEEEQKQQHMVALRRFRDDVESKKLSLSQGQRLFNIKVTDIDEKVAILNAEKVLEAFVDLQGEEERNLGSINGDTYGDHKPLEEVKTWQNQLQPTVAVAEELRTDAAEVSTLMRRQVMKQVDRHRKHSETAEVIKWRCKRICEVDASVSEQP
jgi:hypothetical protein